jgi:hypothetical protein
MKLERTIVSDNGQIQIYDNDYYIVKRSYEKFEDLIFAKDEVLEDLILNGFYIKTVGIELDVQDELISFVLKADLKYMK